MEAPNPFVTVETFQPSTFSHPGPVYESREGVFQSSSAGNYAFDLYVSLPVTHLAFSYQRPGVSDISSRATQFVEDATPAVALNPFTTPEQHHSVDPSAAPGYDSSRRIFALYYQNVRGIRTKIVQLRLLLSSCDYEVLVFTETWLRADIDNAEISPEYKIYRCDRSAQSSQHSRGGGVLIAVKSHLNSGVVILSNCENLEQVAVCIRLKCRCIYLVAVYLPPNSSVDSFSAHASAVQQIADRASAVDIIVSLGDFNLPHLQWQLDDDINGLIPSNVSTEHEQVLIETMFTIGLQQFHRYSNVNGRLLDLIFVSHPEQLDIIEPTAPLLPVDTHHVPVVVLFDERSDVLVEQRTLDSELRFDFRSCDFGRLKVVLDDIDWDILLQTGSLDRLVSKFYDKLFSVLDDNVPRKRRAIHNSNKPWWTSELRHLRNVLRKARHRFFRTKTEINRVNLRDIEAHYKSVLKSTYDNYLSKIQASVKQNPSCFWDFVKSRQNSTRIPRNVIFENVQANTDTDAANLFASFFESVFSVAYPVSKRDSFAHIQSHTINLPVIRFSVDDVANALDDLDIKKGCGTDGIPSLLLQKCSTELANPIARLFNKSLQEKTFPIAWKTAFVVPIHKSGNCNQVTNYRGISMLCCLSKVFERLMHKVLYNVASPIIFNGQHGFMRHRSTTSNLMCYVTALSREIEERRQVDAVYVDFAKAFDTVPHFLVTEKMKCMGFPDWITEWISSYLCGRTAHVVVNAAKSRSFYITSGVPQGSVLGPLLFNIFMNDLYSLLSSLKLSFADDLKIYRVISSPLDCVVLQEDINSMLEWCCDNGMRVNEGKCKTISFGRSKSPIVFQYKMELTILDRTTAICDLGVTIDSKLRFNDHVGIMTAKAFSVLGFIRRHAYEFSDIHVLKIMYCSLVRSILEYAAPVWSPFYVVHNLRIERVQKKFIRFALRQLPWNDPLNLPPYADRCKLIGLDTLSVRRTTIQRLFIFDVLQGNIDCPELLAQVSLNIPIRRSRNSSLLSVPFHRTNYGYNNPLDSCIRLFNVVCDVFDFNLTKNAFKNRINNYI